MPPPRVDYTPLPFVREPYRDSGYGLRLADLMRDRGNREAAMHLQRGDVLAQMWGQAGQSIMGAVNQYQRDQDFTRQRAIEERSLAQREAANALALDEARLNLDEKKRQQKGAAMTRSLLPLARKSNGVVGYDRELLAREFETAGMADMLPQVFTALDEQETSYLKVMEARRDAVAADAWRVLQSGADPETFDALLTLWGENDLAPKREIDALRKAAKAQGPQAALMAAVQSSPRFAELVQQATAPKLHNVPEGATVIDERTGQVVHQGQPKAPTPTIREGLYEGKPSLLRIDPQTGEAQPIAGVQPIPPRDPQGPAPSFQRAEVLNDAGVPTMANFDARTGAYTDPEGRRIQNPRPVPGASQTADAQKFKQAAPILASVSELSERINTLQGAVAKASGEVERQKARVNLNDDVAEYEALVSGFTPLVARALGHVGVLTQQDVDSVKALFPKPGDSKSLRDRKIARIRSIFGQLETGAQQAPVTTTPGAAPPGDGWTDVGGFKVRVKP